MPRIWPSVLYPNELAKHEHFRRYLSAVRFKRYRLERNSLKPLPIQAKSNLDIGVVIVSSLLLFSSMLTGKKRLLDRWEGIVFLFLYGGYITFPIIKG